MCILHISLFSAKGRYDFRLGIPTYFNCFFYQGRQTIPSGLKNKHYRKALLPHFPIQLKRIKHVVFRTKKHITYDIIPVRNYL